MHNYIIFNKKYIQNLKYEKLISDNLNFAILECKCKNLNIIYAIEEEDNFVYFGATSTCLNSMHFTTIELKKNYTLFLNVDKIQKYITKIFENQKIDNLYLFRSKLINLNESYKDLYLKMLRNLIKKNNLIIYTCKISDIHMNFTNYIFDIIYISNDDFNEILNSISNIELSFSNFLILNMNYLLFNTTNEDIFNILINNREDSIYISNNNNKNKNFMISNFKNIKMINNISKKYIENVNIIKICN